LRTGLVLGTEGGMLTQLLTPFEFGLGGPIGDGRQWMSWIDRDDLVRLIGHVLQRAEIAGPINATAPVPVRNSVFVAALGHALGRPVSMRVPSGLLARIGGDLARELLLGGQKVLPARALETGFMFACPTLEQAFARMLGAGLRARSLPSRRGRAHDDPPVTALPSASS
jgi:uncharacterized protein